MNTPLSGDSQTGPTSRPLSDDSPLPNIACLRPLLDKAAFDKLSRHEKRVALSKDLLLRVEEKRIVAYRGKIVRLLTMDIFGSEDNVRTQEIINNPSQPCEACAKGGLLLAWIGNFDSFNAKALFNVNHNGVAAGFPAELVEIFGSRLLCALEVAFEQDWFPWTKGHVTLDEISELQFAFVSVTELRLALIYQNLIDNQGRLVIKTKDGTDLVFD